MVSPFSYKLHGLMCLCLVLAFANAAAHADNGTWSRVESGENGLTTRGSSL